jgi:hypothetical protein
MLLAGDPSIAEQVVRSAEVRLQTDSSISDTVGSMENCLKECYQTVREVHTTDAVLRPLLLDKSSFTARTANLLPLNDVFMLEITRRLTSFNVNSQLLVAGFDKEDKGHVISINDPGLTTSHDISGYGAIGIGGEVALSRLLWAMAEPGDDLDMALYQAFEAKAYAETIQGVGFYSDAWVMVPGETVKVPIRILALLHGVFLYSAQLPFKRREGWTPTPPPPKNWEVTLRKFTNPIPGKMPASQSGPGSNAQ